MTKKYRHYAACKNFFLIQLSNSRLSIDAIKDITVKLRKKAMKILTLKKERSMINEAKNIEKR